VRKATAGGSGTTELPPATEISDHFQLSVQSADRSKHLIERAVLKVITNVLQAAD